MKTTIINPVLQETLTFTTTSAQSGGMVSNLELTLTAGGGNPLHYHTSYSETFTAIEGELSLELGNRRTLVLQPGQSHVVEIGQVHRFFNPTDRQIRFRNEVRPGHAGFENALRILAGLATDGLYDEKKRIPKNFAYLAVIGIMSDMRLPGLMSFTTPVLRLVAAQARRQGTEKALLDRYCR